MLGTQCQKDILPSNEFITSKEKNDSPFVPNLFINATRDDSSF